MVCMLSRIPERGRRHDISRRIDACATRNQAIESIRESFKVFPLPKNWADVIFKSLPCLNPIENFEQQSPKENFLRVLRSFDPIMNFQDQILAYTVGSTIRVSEPVVLEDRIGGPPTNPTAQPPIEDRLPFGGKTPIGVENFRGSSCPDYIGRQPPTWRSSGQMPAGSRQLIRREKDRHGAVAMRMADPERQPLRLSVFDERVRETDEMGPEPDTAFLGLFGEIGSLVSALKKRRRDKDAYFGYERAVLEEVGDVLWYASAFARRGGTSLAEVASRAIGDGAPPPNQVSLGEIAPAPEQPVDDAAIEMALLDLAGEAGDSRPSV